MSETTETSMRARVAERLDAGAAQWEHLSARWVGLEIPPGGEELAASAVSNSLLTALGRSVEALTDCVRMLASEVDRLNEVQRLERLYAADRPG